MAKSSDSGLVKAVVLFDRYRWLDDDGTVQSASKNATIEVSADEFKRGKGLNALAKPGKDAEQAQQPADVTLTTPGGDPIDEPVEPGENDPSNAS